MPSAISVLKLRELKRNGIPIAVLTAYDATFARIFDQAGVDVLLVGDSLGMVIQGNDNTLSVSLDEMVYHTRAVARGAQNSHIVADLPFMSYQISPKQALGSAGRLVQEAGAHAVKLEGAKHLQAIEHIVAAGIPVMGHVGLTPQTYHQMGGFRVQGKTDTDAKRILTESQQLQDAGCYSIVLEGVPDTLAAKITKTLSIPTIGIGAGVHCDGQVLVCYDMLGMFQDFKPKFVKHYADHCSGISTAVENYIGEVKSKQFPTNEHSFGKNNNNNSPPTKPYGSGE